MEGKTEVKIGFLDGVKQCCQLEAEKSAKGLYETAALVGAASCLAQVKNITDPVEQVKYLHEEFLYGDLNLQRIPWVWLKRCITENLITKLPREDWIIAVFISGAYFEGGPEVVLGFLKENNLPYSLP